MSATYTLFLRWKDLKGHASAMAACAELGVERQAATYWKDGRNAEAQVIERMANDLGENPAAWVLAAAAEKSRAADEKRTLLRMAKQFGYAACLTMIAFLPYSAQAKSYLDVYTAKASESLYIMSNQGYPPGT